MADLERLIEAFKADPENVGTYVEPDTLEELLDPGRRELRAIYIPGQIAVRVGETAYNLRCVLDYLVFALAWHDAGVEPSGEWAEGLQFPIESDPERFERRRLTLLKGLSDPHVALIREYQPAHGCRWTAVLAAINNLDKHRHLVHLTGSASSDLPDGLEWVTTDDEAIRALAGVYPIDQMHVEPRSVLDVVFPDGRLVTETLQEIKLEVTELMFRVGKTMTAR